MFFGKNAYGESADVSFAFLVAVERRRVAGTATRDARFRGGVTPKGLNADLDPRIIFVLAMVKERRYGYS